LFFACLDSNLVASTSKQTNPQTGNKTQNAATPDWLMKGKEPTPSTINLKNQKPTIAL